MPPHNTPNPSVSGLPERLRKKDKLERNKKGKLQ
jgi:hypothetical protein